MRYTRRAESGVNELRLLSYIHTRREGVLSGAAWVLRCTPPGDGLKYKAMFRAGRPANKKSYPVQPKCGIVGLRIEIRQLSSSFVYVVCI